MELPKKEENLTNQFIDFIWDFAEREIIAEYKAEVSCTLVDYLGAYFAGVYIGAQHTKPLLNLLHGEGNSHPIGLQQKVSLENAALINGIFGHYAELDDGNRMGMLHPGVIIFSSLLAWQQKYPIDETNFYKAVMVGYEVSIRLAETAQPAAKLKGFHGTGIFGTIGAALACAVAANATKKQLKNTLSAATTAASGILRVIKNTSQLKPFNAGNASKNAISAALVALANFEGPIEVLDGDLGFLSMYDNNFKKQLLCKPKLKPKIVEIYRKPYAACRHCHPAIDIALQFKSELSTKPDEIEAVEVYTYGIGIPGHDHTQIVGVNSAKMSTPYSFAVAFCTGKAGIAQFEENYFKQDTITQLTHKVSVQPNSYFDEHFPNKRGAEIQLKLKSGKTFTKKVDLPKGEPETALTASEIQTKFFELTEFAGIPIQKSESIYNLTNRTDFNLDALLIELQTLDLASELINYR